MVLNWTVLGNLYKKTTTTTTTTASSKETISTSNHANHCPQTEEIDASNTKHHEINRNAKNDQTMQVNYYKSTVANAKQMDIKSNDVPSMTVPQSHHPSSFMSYIQANCFLLDPKID